MTITTSTVSGMELTPYISTLAQLRIRVFREYPYLYDGSEAYETRYLQTYIASSGAMAVLAFDRGKIIGASTGVPMADETDIFRQPFENQGIDTESLFYCGESILLPAYRGRGIYKSFFSWREKYARDKGFNTMCFCGVTRPDNHPARPADYQPLDDIWRRFGYAPNPALITYLTWKEIGQSKETDHAMLFWLKGLTE